MSEGDGPGAGGLKEAIRLPVGITVETLSGVSEEFSVADKIALGDAQMRKLVSFWIMILFGAVNGFTLVFIAWLACVDQHELKIQMIYPGERLVTAQLVMALLGATTVQLGTISVIMAKYVFKPPG